MLKVSHLAFLFESAVDSRSLKDTDVFFFADFRQGGVSEVWASGNSFGWVRHEFPSSCRTERLFPANTERWANWDRRDTLSRGHGVTLRPRQRPA